MLRARPSGGAAIVYPLDPPCPSAQLPELGFAESLPPARYRAQPPLFLKGLEGQPPAAVPLGKHDAALRRHPPLHSGTALRPMPGHHPGPPAIRGARPSLYTRRLGIPRLPVRPISVNKSTICHNYLLPSRGPPAKHPKPLQVRCHFRVKTEPKLIKFCLSRFVISLICRSWPASRSSCRCVISPPNGRGRCREKRTPAPRR